MEQKGDFFERVYHVAAQIPEGKVTSYGLIAKFLGAPRSSRAVGYAMTAAVDRDEIPTHRVVNRVGLLTGRHHFPGTNLMQQLLENEGLVIIDNQVKDFHRNCWDPMNNL